MTAIAAFAIPATSIIAWFDIFPVWSSQSASSLGIDLAALVTGFLMLLLAKKAKYRAINGAPDSVWSFHSYRDELQIADIKADKKIVGQST